MSRSCLNRPPNCAFAGRESVRWGTGPRKHSARARTCQALQSCTTIEALGEGRRGAAVSSKLGAARFGGGALAAALVATGRTAASRQASSSPYARSPATAAGCWLDSPMGCKLSATAPRVRVPRGKFPLQQSTLGVYTVGRISNKTSRRLEDILRGLLRLARRALQLVHLSAAQLEVARRQVVLDLLGRLHADNDDDAFAHCPRNRHR